MYTGDYLPAEQPQMELSSKENTYTRDCLLATYHCLMYNVAQAYDIGHLKKLSGERLIDWMLTNQASSEFSWLYSTILSSLVKTSPNDGPMEQFLVDAVSKKLDSLASSTEDSFSVSAYTGFLRKTIANLFSEKERLEVELREEKDRINDFEVDYDTSYDDDTDSYADTDIDMASF